MTTFLSKLNAFRNYAGLKDTDALVLLSVLLQDRAATWWQANQASTAGDNITDWHSFESGFRSFFLPHDIADHHREALHSLRQRGRPVTLYLADFESLALLIPDLHATERFSRFKPGLDRDLLTMASIDLNNLASYETLCRAVLRLDSLRTPARAVSHATTATPPSAASSAPSSAARPPAFPKLTPAERQRLIRLGACLRCRQVAGHIAANCPVFPRDRRAPAAHAVVLNDRDSVVDLPSSSSSLAKSGNGL